MSLPAFLHAIGTIESGNDYDAIGPQTSKYGKARGRYQIMEKIWPGWAAEAGIPGANWRDPKAQDKVASYKMSQYFKKYGRWDLVAVAWFAGPGRADKAAREGIGSVGGISDVLGTDVATYVQKAMKVMGKPGPPPPDVVVDRHTDTQGRMRRVEAGQADPGDRALTPADEFTEGRRASADTMASIMDFISKASARQGGQLLDTGALLGDLTPGRDEDEDEVA